MSTLFSSSCFCVFLENLDGLPWIWLCCNFGTNRETETVEVRHTQMAILDSCAGINNNGLFESDERETPNPHSHALISVYCFFILRWNFLSRFVFFFWHLFFPPLTVRSRWCFNVSLSTIECGAFIALLSFRDRSTLLQRYTSSSLYAWYHFWDVPCVAHVWKELHFLSLYYALVNTIPLSLIVPLNDATWTTEKPWMLTAVCICK